MRDSSTISKEAMQDFCDFLHVQMKSLNYLSISGIQLNSAVQKCLSNGKNLTTLELELDEVALSENTILSTIKLLGAWKTLIFKEVGYKFTRLVKDIINPTITANSEGK